MISEQECLYTKYLFSVIDPLPVGVCVLRKDYTVLAWNNRISRWTHIDSDSMIGKDIRTVFPHFQTNGLSDLLESVFNGRDPVVFPDHASPFLPVDLENGESMFLKTTAYPAQSFNGCGFYSVLSVEEVSYHPDRFPHDVFLTESAGSGSIEEELKEKNKLMQSILSATPIATILVENRVVKWGNEAAMKLFGYSEDDYKELDLLEFYAGNAWYYAVSDTVIRMAGSENLIETDAEFKRKNGDIFTGHLMMTCINPQNPLERNIATICDLTARIQAEQIRIQREKLLSILDLAGAICHELNQPLMAISGYSELLLMGMENNHPHYGKLAKINDQIKKTADITRKLMGITKYDIGRLLETSQHFCLNNLKLPRI